jgi:N-acylneuraminate cytidylyltransferase
VTSSSNSRSSVAVIPARGGSKRIPRKNIRVMNGRPLIAWAIETALASDAFSDVVVSTDDDEIAGIARDSGASVPFMRPAALADDVASTVSVVAHAVDHLREDGVDIDLACCIYPASILVTPDDLRRAREVLLASSRDYVSTIVRYGHPIQRALDVGADGALSVVDPTAAASRTQDLPPRWHDAGQFYWGRVAAWRDEIAILPNSVGYELPAHRAVDIDTEDDWLRAERLHAVALGL